jgi:arylamine N-acetyltransferase
VDANYWTTKALESHVPVTSISAFSDDGTSCNWRAEGLHCSYLVRSDVQDSKLGLIMPETAMNGRPTFTKAQLEQYFDRIVLPQEQRLFSVLHVSDQQKLQYLGTLQKHHLVKVPFENLALHYSWHRAVDVNPEVLFKKIVLQQGRGGYCMEVNSLLHVILFSLGFDVYMTGARIYNPGKQQYGGFSHCVNIITIVGAQYMVDVGYGANGPSRPVLLEPGHEQTHVAAAKMRCMYDSIPQNLNRSGKLWILQHKIDGNASWVPQYCFADFEFLPEDVCNMNLAPWKSPASWFPQRVVVVRFTTTEESDDNHGPQTANEAAVATGEIDGVLIVDQDKLKWRRGGATVMEKSFGCDDDRVSSLSRYFGINLAAEDQEAIRGTVGELRPTN